MGEVCKECGSPKRHRSDVDHRHYFAVLKAAFDNWPESDIWQPEDQEHLRAYLQMHAGHMKPVDVESEGKSPKALADQIRAVLIAFDIKHPFIHAYADRVRIFVPLSMSYAEADKPKFREVKTKVLEIIKARTGIDPDKIMEAA